MADSRYLLGSSALFFLAFIITAGAATPVQWISSFFHPYLPLAYLFVLVGAFVFLWACTGNWKISVVLAMLAFAAYLLLMTGWLIGG